MEVEWWRVCVFMCLWVFSMNELVNIGITELNLINIRCSTDFTLFYFRSFFAWQLFPSSLFLCSSCWPFRASIGQYCVILYSLSHAHLFSSLSHQQGLRFRFRLAILRTPTSLSTKLGEGICCLIDWSHSLFVLNYSLTMGASDVSILY